MFNANSVDPEGYVFTFFDVYLGYGFRILCITLGYKFPVLHLRISYGRNMNEGHSFVFSFKVLDRKCPFCI